MKTHSFQAKVISISKGIPQRETEKRRY